MAIQQLQEEVTRSLKLSKTNTIAQLPIIPLDKKNPEDVDTKGEDHLYDAIRYGVMSRPRSSVFDYNPATSGRTGVKTADPVFGY